MLELSDFVPIKVPKKQKCYTYKCASKPSEMQFYITEWELLTGASTDGLIYCEKCIKNHYKEGNRG